MSPRRTLRKRNHPEKRSAFLPSRHTRDQERHGRMRRVLRNHRSFRNRRGVGTLRNLLALVNENGSGLLRRPFRPRRSRLGVVNRSRHGDSRIRMRNVRSGNGDRNPVSERDGRPLKRTLLGGGFRKRPRSPFGMRKRDDSRRSGIRHPASARNRDRRRRRKNRGVERDIRHHWKPPAERQRFLRVVPHRNGVLLRFGQNRSGRRSYAPFGLWELHVRLHSLMRKRFGSRKRRYGRIFGFYAIVLDVSRRETRDIRNTGLRGSPWSIRTHGAILSLRRKELRTRVFLFRLR